MHKHATGENGRECRCRGDMRAIIREDWARQAQTCATTRALPASVKRNPPWLRTQTHTHPPTPRARDLAPSPSQS